MGKIEETAWMAEVASIIFNICIYLHNLWPSHVHIIHLFPLSMPICVFNLNISCYL